MPATAAHSDAQLRRSTSVRRFGWSNPCWWTARTASSPGKARPKRRLKLGMESCDIELAGLSDTQRRAYIIADNKLALNGGWDDELLALELGELRRRF